MKLSAVIKQMQTIRGDNLGPAAVAGEDSGADLFVHVQN